jgi:carbon monoxide dehydrogenase subunit G
VTIHRRKRTARPRGRQRARGLLAAVAIVATAGTATASPGAGAVDQAVEVSRQTDIYHVAATFTVAEPPRAVLAALTDYPGIPRFMPEVEHSSVVARRTDGVVVEQAAVAKFLMFTRRIHLLLDITERPGSLRFRDTCGQSFVHYDGSWTIAVAGGRTHVTYALAAQPAFDVPEFLLRRLLKRDAVRMIARLKTEITARAVSLDCRTATCQ